MSFTNRLAARNVPHALKFPVQEELIADQLAFSLEARELEDNIAEFTRVSCAFESVERLSQEFFTGDDVISFEQARLYELSVESILSAAGIDVVKTMTVPSFESSTDYSVEAASKAGNMFSRAVAWLMGLLRKIGDGIMALVARFRASAVQGKARLLKMKDRMTAAYGKKAKEEKKPEASTESSEVAAQVSVRDISVFGSSTADPVSVMNTSFNNTKSSLLDILSIVRKTMVIAKGLSTKNLADEGHADKAVTDLSHAMGLNAGNGTSTRDFKVGANQVVRMTLTAPNDILKVKVSMQHTAEKKAGTMKALDEKQADALYEACIHAYDNLDSIQGPADTAGKIFKTMADSMDSASKATSERAAASSDSDKASGLGTASIVFSLLGNVVNGLAKVPSELLKGYAYTQWGAEQYLDASIAHHSK